MRFFLLLLLCGYSNVYGQSQDLSSRRKDEVSITFKCWSSKPINDKPLLIIDEKIFAFEFLKEINPNDIKSIRILKAKEALLLHGKQGEHGVVNVQTKSRNLHLKVLDKSTHLPIAYASITFIGNDTTTLVTDKNGWMKTTMGKTFSTQAIVVFSTGYKPVKIVLDRPTDIEVELDPDYKNLESVFVTTSGRISCSRHTIRCGYNSLKIHKQDDIKSAPNNFNELTVYPNPVRAGSQIHIIVQGEAKGNSTTALYTLSGQKITNYVQTNHKHLSLIIPQLSAGTYLLMMLTDNQRHVEKIIVQ